MDEFTAAIAELKAQITSYHADLRVFMTEYQAEYKAMCSRQSTISLEVEQMDTAIRGNGKAGLSERIGRIEQQTKVLIGIVSLIGTILVGFGVNSLLVHLFP